MKKAATRFVIKIAVAELDRSCGALKGLLKIKEFHIS